MLNRVVALPRAGGSKRAGARPGLLAIAAAAVLAGCAQNGLQSGLDTIQELASGGQPATAAAAKPDAKAADAKTVAAQPVEKPSSQAASEALAEARARRLSGDKAGALALLDKAALQHPKDRGIAKERAFLTLDLGKLAAAEQQLRRLANPKTAGYAVDWRVHSALGAALFAVPPPQPEAQVELQKALELAPDHPSVLNNLAMSYALDGKAKEAESLLRRVAEVAPTSSKARQNLALMVGLNGRPEEAEKLASAALPPEKAKANASRLAELARTPVDATAPATAETPRSARAEQPWQSSLFNLGGPRQ